MMLYPLKFKPLLVEKIWGGRKIQDVLGQPLPAGKLIGESWGLYDFPPGVIDGAAGWVSAEVANGPLAGRTLHQLIEQHGRALCGDLKMLPPQGQFPILIKFLDARENLSVQVHPDEKYAAGHPGAYLKSEAWYVVQSDPGSKLLKGLVPGATRDQFKAAVEAGTVDRLIKAIAVKAGDCVYLPSGTVHALGAGILAAEVQTPSDTTYRVFDFGRIDPSTGRPRKLHVTEALDCIDFDRPDPPPQPRSHSASAFTTVTRLVDCPFFRVEKVRFNEGVEDRVPYDQPVVWMMLDGEAQITVEGVGPTKLAQGDVALLPADMKDPVLQTRTDCAWLEVTIK